MAINEYDDLLQESAKTAPPSIQAPTVNEYDDLAGSDKDALKASMYVSQGKDPGRQAELENLSKQANLPVDFVERNYDLVKSKFEKKADPNAVYDKAPRASTWLADPNNAALSNSDLDKIIAMEGDSKTVNKNDMGFFESAGNAASTSYHQLEVSYWQSALMTGKVDPEVGAKHLAEASRNYRAATERAPVAAKNFKKVMEQEYGDIDKAFNQVIQSKDDIHNGNVLEALKNFSVGGAKTIYETLDLIGSSVKSKEQATGLVYTAAEQFGNSLPSIGLGIAGGVAGGATTLGAGAFIGYQAGSFLGEAISEVASSIGEVAAKKGYNFEDEESIKKFYSDPALKQEVMDAAIRKGVTTASVDAFFNLFAGKKFLGALKKEGAGVGHIIKETAKDVGTQMAGEAASEYAGQVAREKGLEGASLGESIYEGVNALGSEMVSVPVGAVHRQASNLISGGPKEEVAGTAKPPVDQPKLRSELDKDPIKASEQLVKKADEALNVERKTLALKNIGDQVKAMENVTKVPGKVGELVKVMTDENDVKSVFFQTNDWIKYWQDKGLNPSEEIGKIVEDGVARLQEAQNNGHQLEIPLSNFVDKVATTEHYNPLIETAAVEPGGMTFSQAQVVQEELQGTLEVLAQEATAPNRVQSEGSIIRSNVEKQLIDAGMAPKEARVNSKLVQKAYEARAQKLGKSPLQLIKEDNLQITGDNRVMYQSDEKPIGSQFDQQESDPKAKIIFGNGFVNIALLGKANRSSFAHETGHLYLHQMMNDFSTISKLDVKSDLQNQFLEDSKKTLDWLGVESFDKITVKEHEQFARGFEAYLMEGKAPSKDLRRIFALFRSWLLDIYKGMSALNVDLSEDVKEVFNRMLVVDEKISQVKAENNMDKFFNNLKELGVPDEQALKYARLRDDHNIRATEILQKQVMGDWQKQKTKWYKERFDATKKEVTQEVNKIPVYAAVDAMRNKDILGQNLKLSKEAIAQLSGEEIIKTLPKGIYAADGGVHPDMVAGLFGFNSGSELIDRMSKIMQSRQGLMSWEQIKKDLILTQTNDIMNKNYPSLITMEDNFHAEATKAVHNDLRADVLEMEHEMLLKENPNIAKKIIGKLINRLPSKKFIKEEASKTIGRRKVSELKPHLYRRAEVKASKETGVLFNKGDIDGAIESKKNERLNFALFNAAVEEKENYVKQLVFFRKLYRKDADIAKSRDLNYIDAARAVLANFGLGKTERTAHDYLANVKKYDPGAYESLLVQIESLPFKPKPLDELTVDEFKQVSDLVNSLYEISKSVKEIEVGGQKFEIEKIANDMSVEIGKITPENKKKYNQTSTDSDKFKIKLLGWKSRLLRMESWAHTMDLGNINGVFTKFIWQPINEGVTQYRIEKEKYIKQYKAVLDNYKHLFTPQEILAPELTVAGKQFLFKNKGELLGALLHTGNNSNKKKLIVGRKWGTVDDSGALDTRNWDKFVNRMIEEKVLTKDDFDFIQSVWNLFEEMKPAAQKAHKKLYGHYFAEVTADPIITPFGEYRGGYAPAVVDRSESFDQDLRMDKEAIESQVDSFMFPSTGRGFTKSRVEQYAAPLVLDLNLVGGHIDKVSRFSNIQPKVTQVHRLITDDSLNEALNQYDPTIRKNLIMPFLDRAAKQTLEIPSGYDNKLVDDMFRTIRKRIGQSFMFGNVFNILQQGIGLSLAASKVKPGLIRSSLFRYLTSPGKTTEEIVKKSAWMNQRMKGQIHETINAIDKITVTQTKFDKVRDFADANAYVGQTLFQNMLDAIVWPAAYDQAIRQGLDEDSAVRSADHVVRTTQSSMNPEDSSTYEMGTPFERSFKQFFSYFNMLANLKASEFIKIIRSTGLKKGKSDLFFQTLYLFVIPSVINSLLVKGAAGGIGDDEDAEMDELAATFFGDIARTEFASVPGGQLLTLGLNTLNDNYYDDRLSTNPTFSVIEGLVTGTAKTAKQLWEEEEVNKKRAIRDSFTLFSLFTGVPITPLSKPIGYLIDVSEGEANPTGPIDFTRGLVTGRKGSE